MEQLPEFINLSTIDEYKKHFIDKYCKKELITFDGIRVKFYEDQFDYAFYESSNKKK